MSLYIVVDTRNVDVHRTLFLTYEDALAFKNEFDNTNSRVHISPYEIVEMNFSENDQELQNIVKNYKIGKESTMKEKFFEAAQNGDVLTIEKLLTAGIDPNIQDKHGWTALMYAAHNSSSEGGTSSEEMVKILLAKGADPNIQDECGWTALMIAARHSSPENGTSSEKTVEILLAAGADPNKQNKYGDTALMAAARFSSPERGESSEKTVEILLTKGADPKIINYHEKTAKDLTDTPSVKQLIEKYLIVEKS